MTTKNGQPAKEPPTFTLATILRCRLAELDSPLRVDQARAELIARGLRDLLPNSVAVMVTKD